MKIRRWKRALGIAAAALVLMAVLFVWRVHALLRADFSLTTPFFSGKRVMVLVPHQDDELNLAGGLLEQYTAAGSEVMLVYATNGDYNGLAELRSEEALAVAASVGIPAEDVYYLGYGDQWEHQGAEKHLYFASDGDALWTSHFGAAHTYGTEVIDCWRSSDYTRNNFLDDLRSLILQKRPDVIYCVDYDAHHDHMALDLFFGEVMGDILATVEGYRPTVYKGFCYGTAWYAEADWLGAENLLSSKHPAWEHWERLGIGYDWDARLRLPVTAEDAHRLLSRTTLYRSIRLFGSQNGDRFAESVLNGDKVFWQRRTDSLLYRAEFTAAGEQIPVWNDFKLKDSRDFSSLINTGAAFAPEITVELEAPAEMDAVWLYDHPSARDNILGGFLRFDDGTQVEFGPLEPGGSATRIEFDRRTVGSFDICFTRTEGENPGITEIEAYCGEPEAGPLILMAVDHDDNFVYDYWLPEGDTAEFTLYSWPGAVSWEDVELSSSGGLGCRWEVRDGKLRVMCPPGASIRFTASCGEASVTFTVANPTPAERELAEKLRQTDHDRILPQGQ